MNENINLKEKAEKYNSMKPDALIILEQDSLIHYLDDHYPKMRKDDLR